VLFAPSSSTEEIAQIVGLELDKVRTRLVEYGLGLQVTEAAQALIAEEGYSEEYGARPLRRVIQNRIEDPLSDAVLAGSFASGDTVLVDAEEEKIVLCQAEETVKDAVPVVTSGHPLLL
jgi:ATP-dependent Clp protease ATP-binding subunit ClpC